MRWSLQVDSSNAQQSVLWEASFDMGAAIVSSVEGAGTMNVQCTWRFAFSSSDQAKDVESSADLIMEALLASEQVHPHLGDAALSLDLTKGEMEISLLTGCQSVDDGIHKVMTAISAAINAAGGEIVERAGGETDGPAVRWSIQHEELVVS